MNKHFEKLLDIYNREGIDTAGVVGWHLDYGVVVSDSRCFALCYHSDSREPEEAVEYDESDTLFVTFFTGDMRHGLQPYLDQYKFIAFQRDFKNSPRIRLLDMRKFHSKLKK